MKNQKRHQKTLLAMTRLSPHLPSFNVTCERHYNLKMGIFQKPCPSSQWGEIIQINFLHNKSACLTKQLQVAHLTRNKSLSKVSSTLSNHLAPLTQHVTIACIRVIHLNFVIKKYGVTNGKYKQVPKGTTKVTNQKGPKITLVPKSTL